MAEDFFSVRGSAREAWISRQDAPAWCHPSVAITSTISSVGTGARVTIKVAPDYWGYLTHASSGEESFMRTPMKPKTAQVIADKYGYLLPNTKIVQLILANGHRLHACTQKVRDEDAYRRINACNERDCLPYLREELVCGHRKDIVITNYLTNGKVAIYGWHGASGEKPIQPLSTVHSQDYMDYSHGARMIDGMCTVERGGIIVEMRLADVLKDKELCKAVSNEGVMKVLAYR